jgi:hypothetical protein
MQQAIEVIEEREHHPLRSSQTSGKHRRIVCSIRGDTEEARNIRGLVLPVAVHDDDAAPVAMLDEVARPTAIAR